MSNREGVGERRRGALPLRRLAVALPACAAAMLIVALLAAHTVTQPFGIGLSLTPRPMRRSALSAASVWPTGTVDVNTATAEELCALHGIGPKLAQAIVDERTARGGFAFPEDLIAVKGIGAKTLAKFVAQLDFSAQAQAATRSSGWPVQPDP